MPRALRPWPQTEKRQAGDAYATSTYTYPECRAALKRTGLQIHFHDLRHACITRLAESQASEQTLLAVSGHLSRRMIEPYSPIRLEAKRAALDAIAAVPINRPLLGRVCTKIVTKCRK